MGARSRQVCSTFISLVSAFWFYHPLLISDNHWPKHSYFSDTQGLLHTVLHACCSELQDSAAVSFCSPIKLVSPETSTDHLFSIIWSTSFSCYLSLPFSVTSSVGSSFIFLLIILTLVRKPYFTVSLTASNSDTIRQSNTSMLQHHTRNNFMGLQH